MARTPKSKHYIAVSGGAASRRAQPGAVVSSTLTIEPAGGLYRAGMYAELQKFGKSQREQLQLWEGHQGPPAEVETIGLDLSISQERALSAIQILADRTGYKGNLPPRRGHSAPYQRDYDRPVLAFTPAEYLEAYGLQRGPKNTFSSGRRAEAMQALESLSESWTICYKRRKVVKGKELFDVIRHSGPLLELTKGWRDLEQQEAEAVEHGAHLPERMAGIIVTLSPLLVDELKTFWLLKPIELHNEILQFRGSRAPRAISLFIQWLLTLDLPQVTIDKETLIDRLRLADLYHKQRQKTRVQKQLQEALETAKELHYLLAYTQEPQGLIRLTLNPERCTRIGARGRHE